MEDNVTGSNEYVVIKAKSNGCQVFGLTRGQDTRLHHSEKIGQG